MGAAQSPKSSAAGTKAAQAKPDPPVVDVAGYQKIIAERKGKVVLLNFWATWCPPCRDEYPLLNDVARTFEAQGLVVLGASMDDDAEMNLVRRFLARNNPTFQNYRVKPGIFEEFVHAVDPRWRGALPTTFLYDRQGRLALRLDGPQTREQFAAAARAVLSANTGR
jgi:thiol-disulfide isomerase/thioredoxin